MAFPSRRRLLAAAAVSIMGCGRVAASPRTIHVTPDGAGDGSSWSAAARLGELGTLIASAQSGGEILIAAERGEYALGAGLDIDVGGGGEALVRVRGANSETGEPMLAVLRGSRTQTEQGDEAFRLRRGAGNLHFSHLDFRDVGNGCFRVGGPLQRLTIEDCAFENVYRFLENTVHDGEREASLLDFVVRRCRGSRVERGFLRIRYGSRSGIIEDCLAQGMANEGGPIPAGCALDDEARDIVYRRCIMETFQQWRAGRYWNGDGFSDEPGNANIRYEACEARGSTDGGFDCKGRNVALENCLAEDNKRNFRIWDDRATLTGCTSRSPNFRGREVEDADACHIWIGGENAEILMANLTIEDADATQIFEFDHDRGSVQVRGLTIHSPRQNWNGVQVQTNSDGIVVRPD